jgi:hypothetical protein
MSNVIEITGAQLGRLRKFETGIPYDVNSKKAGKTYSRISFNQKVFTLDDKDPFLVDLEKGRVHTVFLIEVEGTRTKADGSTSTVIDLAFDGYVNNAQMIGMTNTEAVLQSILKGNFKAEAELDEADLKALEQ